MGHSRTLTQNTAGDGFPADPIDGTARVTVWPSGDPPQRPSALHRLRAGGASRTAWESCNDLYG